MDVDDYDYDPPEDDWRCEMEVLGEEFQKALEAKGIKRRFWRRRKEERVKEVSQELQQLLNTPNVHHGSTPPADAKDGDIWIPTGEAERRKMVECPRCHGEGGGMVPHGQEYAHESCDECHGTGWISVPSSEPTFRFKPF